VVDVPDGDLSVWRDVPEDGTDPVSGPQGERVALIELGVVPVHLGQRHDVGADGLEVNAVPGGPQQQRLGDVNAGVGAEVRDGPARVQQQGARVELDAGAAQRRELPGAEQVRGAAPLDPDQRQEVDLPLIGCALEAADLSGAELRGLVEDDAGGLVAVGAPVLGEGVAEQLVGVGFGQVGSAVGLGDGCGAAADDDAVAALVEDLGDGGVEFPAVGSDSSPRRPMAWLMFRLAGHRVHRIMTLAPRLPP
jgi:hypothetical protein